MNQPDLSKLFAEMNPSPCMVDMANLLRLQYNCPICDEVAKIFHDKTDMTMFVWLAEKAQAAWDERQDNAAAWVDFLLSLNREHSQIAAEYINHIKI